MISEILNEIEYNAVVARMARDLCTAKHNALAFPDLAKELRDDADMCAEVLKRFIDNHQEGIIHAMQRLSTRL
jgi:hypothetical protein